MTEKKRAPHLLDEPPILVYPSLADALGINMAVVFQQLHFLLNNQKTAKNMYNFIDGKWWVYNSYSEWKENYFSWLSESTLKGIFIELENKALILSRQGVKSKSDRRKWYTIDYEAWDKFCLTIGQKMSDGDETKNISSNGQKMSDDSSETTTETTSEIKESAAAGATGDVPTKNGRKRDVIFDALGTGLFKIDLSDKAQVQAYMGRIVSLKKKLKTLYPGIPDDLLAEKILSFPTWYHAQPNLKNAALPLGTDTFIGYFSKFMANGTKNGNWKWYHAAYAVAYHKDEKDHPALLAMPDADILSNVVAAWQGFDYERERLKAAGFESQIREAIEVKKNGSNV